MRSLAAPAIGAALCAGVVGALVATIEPRYETKASAGVTELLGLDDTLRVMQLEDSDADLNLDGGAPLVPKGRRALATVRARTAARLENVTAVTLREDVDVIDTAGTVLFPRFKERPRRLKVVAQADDAKMAARIATVFLDEYLAYRQAWYEQEFGSALGHLRRRLRETPPRPRVLRGIRARAQEVIDGTRLTLRIEQGTFHRATAAPVPDDPLTPRPLRDVLVAGFVGALLGWFGPRLLSHLRR